MNHTTPLHTAAALLASATLAFSQGGPLTPPPGAPAPTMKSLDQVEPRIPLVAGAPGVFIGNDGRIDIAQAGSYYLTGNLQVQENTIGIVIFTGGVSIDLMGYSIIAPTSGNAVTAIYVNPNHDNICIQNGHILSTTTFAGNSFTLSGFDGGILVQSSNDNVIITNVTIRGNRSYGIFVNGQGSIVENCSVFICGGLGIQNTNGSVLDSVVHTTGSTGINASVVSNCRVNNSLGNGISAATVSNSYAQSTSSAANGIGSTTVENSVGITSGGHGISATTVSNSRGQSTNSSSGNHGINAFLGMVSGSRGEASGGHGIVADSVSNSVGSSSGANGTNSSGISANRVSNSQGDASTSGGRGISGSFSVTASYGISSGLQGILSTSGTVSDSYGSSSGNTTSSRGIDGQIVTNSRGFSTHASGGAGIIASSLAMNSMGTSSGDSGVFAGRTATNCYGFSGHTAINSHGISSNGTVTSSYGHSNGGDGISGAVVTGSYGYASLDARHGISAYIMESSYGQRQNTVVDKFGIQANRASLCRGGHGESITFRYNMP